MREEIMPIMKKFKSDDEIVSDLNVSRNFLVPTPATIGPESMKANLAASSLLKPKSKPAAIVEPDLEIPGINARA